VENDPKKSPSDALRDKKRPNEDLTGKAKSPDMNIKPVVKPKENIAPFYF